MSKQVNFYIMPNDIPEIQIFLIEVDTLFIPLPIYNPINPYAGQIEITYSRPNWNLIHLSPKNIKHELKFKYDQYKEYYTIDAYRNHTIEFDIGGFKHHSPNKLARGRLYFVTHYYDESNNLQAKNEDFIKWADKVLKLFKKKFLIKGDSFIYYSPLTLEWLKSHNPESYLT